MSARVRVNFTRCLAPPQIVIEGSQTFLVVDRADPATNLEEFTFSEEVGPIWLDV